jgi:hypothetical protein
MTTRFVRTASKGRGRTPPRLRLGVELLERRDVPSALSVADVTVREGPTPTGVLDPAGAARVGLNGTRGITFDTRPTDAHYGDLFVTGWLSHSVARFDWASQTYQPFVAPGSGGLAWAADVAVGPHGNVYVADNSQSIVFRYDGSTGIPLPAPGQTGAVYANAGAVAFGPDGNLYMADNSTNQVLEYQGPAGPSPGTFIRVFTTVTSTVSTISNTGNLAFGPDGNLYVAAITNAGLGQINCYNGATGAPVGSGVFVAPGSGGLEGPREFFFDPTGTALYVISKPAVSQTLPPTGQVLRYQGPNGPNPGAFVETYISAGQANVQIAIGLAYDAAGNFYVSDRDTANVTRFAPSAQATFTVALDSPSTGAVSVNYATANGTAVAGTDYTQTSGTLTFPAGVTSETVRVPITTVASGGPTKTFTLNLSGASGATISRGQATGSILNRQTKFFVVDSGTARTYEYGSGGTSEEITSPVLTFGGTDTAPRGVATTAAGTTVWVVDANKTVYVYSSHGVLLGSWTPGGLRPTADIEGIATNGTDIWLLATSANRVIKYAGAASRLSGNPPADTGFDLAGGKKGNTDATDIVTGGTSFWVVDGGSLRVFKYTLAGAPLGSWAIDPANAHPTGITVNPANASDIWIVDSGTLKVYQYTAAAGRTSGSQTANATFALNPFDTNPQGIADPPAPDTLLPPESAPVTGELPPAVSAHAEPIGGTVTLGGDRPMPADRSGEHDLIDLRTRLAGADRSDLAEIDLRGDTFADKDGQAPTVTHHATAERADDSMAAEWGGPWLAF